ncbi:SGNH/GDSL hydrolase family protein [bacterium]|nr:SGNH/GDSL hydrolase family protein [bacterium]
MTHASSIRRAAVDIVLFLALAATILLLRGYAPRNPGFPNIWIPYLIGIVAMTFCAYAMDFVLGRLIVGERSRSGARRWVARVVPIVGIGFGTSTIVWQLGEPVSTELIMATSVFTGGVAGWILLIAARKDLRWDGALLAWPIAWWILAEFCTLPFRFDIPPEDVNPYLKQNRLRWRIGVHTNLYENFDDATTIPDAHGIERPIASDGRVRIVALGSSSTYGQGLDDKPTQAWPAALERRLGGGYEVFNAGAGGYNSFQLMIYYRDVLTRMHPAVLVFYFGGNESFGDDGKQVYRRLRQLVEDSDCADERCRRDFVRFGTSSRPGLMLARTLDKSVLFKRYRSALISFRERQYYRARRKAGLEALHLPPGPREILKTIVEIAWDEETRVLLVPEISRPNDFAGRPLGEEDGLPYYEHHLMEQVAADYPHVSYLSVRPVFNPRDADRLFLDSTTHLTAEGSDLLAGAIEAELRRLRWVGDNAGESPRP